MSMTRRILRSWLICLPLIAGCATVVEEGEPNASGAQAPVTTATMRFVDLSLGRTVAATIDAKSPSYVVDGGAQRFAAFSIPVDPARRYLDYVSKPFGGIMLPDLKTLVPVFTFLGTDRHVVGTASAGEMRGVSSFMDGTMFAGRVAVPDSARFVVIHGTPSTPGALIAYSGNGTPWSIPGSRLGTLQLTLSNLGMATVRDSGMREDSSKARLFYLASVDGVSVSNASNESARASSGRGFSVTPVLPSRLVPAKPLKVVVVATHTTGAPIHALASMAAGTFWSIQAELDFVPEADKVYVVKGNLEKDASTVWIEEVASGRPVTRKGTSSDRPGRR